MSRRIDQLPAPAHVREKKVIVTARSRTGTFSLYQALNKLGYRSYHMFELHKSALHFDLFEEALKAKHYGVGKPYGKEEFDKWLADYDALVEIPAFFPEEMIAAYPEAKFIHVERDINKWLKSMHNVFTTVDPILRSPIMRIIALYDPFIKSFLQMQKTMGAVIGHGMSPADPRASKFLAEDYVQLSRTVKELAPKENLACFSLEEGFGWNQICPWLGKPIPQEPYPQGNSPKEFDALMSGLLTPKFVTFGALVLTVVVIPVVSFGAWYYRRGLHGPF